MKEDIINTNKFMFIFFVCTKKMNVLYIKKEILNDEYTDTIKNKKY